MSTLVSWQPLAGPPRYFASCFSSLPTTSNHHTMPCSLTDHPLSINRLRDMVTLPSSVVVIWYSTGMGRGFVHMHRCVLESLRVGLVGFHMVGSVTVDIIISFIPFLDSYQPHGLVLLSLPCDFDPYGLFFI